MPAAGPLVGPAVLPSRGPDGDVLLAAWSLGTGIVATVGANLAHDVGHGPVGALVSAWPALALVGSFELLMMLIRTGRGTRTPPDGAGR